LKMMQKVCTPGYEVDGVLPPILPEAIAEIEQLRAIAGYVQHSLRWNLNERMTGSPHG
jgi:hypothetical protein